MNSRPMRRVGAVLAVGLALFSVWLAPACAILCAQAESTGSATSSCHDEGTAKHHESPAGDCQKDLCTHLQAAVNQNRTAELAAPLPAPFFASHSEATRTPLANVVSARVWSKAPSRDLGPPVPPSLFTVLRT